MSTVPGSESWRDAGLTSPDPDAPRRLGDDGPAADDPEEYTPEFGRPDLEGAADEADVVEQDTEVPADEDDA